MSAGKVWIAGTYAYKKMATVRDIVEIRRASEPSRASLLARAEEAETLLAEFVGTPDGPPAWVNPETWRCLGCDGGIPRGRGDHNIGALVHESDCRYVRGWRALRLDVAVPTP